MAPVNGGRQNGSAIDRRLLNHIRLHRLLNYSASLLRGRFRGLWLQIHRVEWDESLAMSTTAFFRDCGSLLRQKLNILLKHHGAQQTIDIDRCDLAVLADILLYHPNFRLLVKKVDKGHLKTLKAVRNKFAHNPNDGYANEEFDQLWNAAEAAVLFFGGEEAEIDKINNLGTDVDSSGESGGELEAANGVTVSASLVADYRVQAEALFKKGEFADSVEVSTSALGLERISVMDRAVLLSGRSKAYLCLAKLPRPRQGDDHSKEYAIDLNPPAKSARSDAKAVIKLRPEWFQGYLDAGHAYVALEKYDKARESFEWALSFAPDREDILFARDECRRKIGMLARLGQVGPTPERPESEVEVVKKIRERFGDVNIEAMRATITELTRGQEETDLGHEARKGENFAVAVEHYWNGAMEGNLEAMYFLALMCLQGEGLAQDFGLVITLFKEVASKSGGDEMVAGSQHALGLCYMEGVGVDEDCAQAAEWFRKASALGYSWATANLACLYHLGRGVPQDDEKAVEYWKLADLQGCPSVALNVAETYLKGPVGGQPDPKLARIWFQRALDGDCRLSDHAKAEFEARLRKKEKELDEMEKQVVKWEVETGHEPGALTFMKRAERMLNTVAPGALEILDNAGAQVQEIRRQGQTPVELVQIFDAQLLEVAADTSSTAQRVLKAVRHFDAASELKEAALAGGDDASIASYVNQMVECVRNEPLAFQFEDEEDRQRVQRLIRHILTRASGQQRSDLDRDARLCNLYTNFNNPEMTLTFARASKEKYPDELAFHRIVATLSAGLGKFELAAEQAKASLSRFPNDADLLFDLAKATQLQARRKKPAKAVNAIKDYECFLKAAPNDHRCVPEAYYAIGHLHMLGEAAAQTAAYEKKYGPVNGARADVPPLAIKNSANGSKYYALGVEAEKRLLPQYVSSYEAGLCLPKCELETALRLNSLVHGKGIGIGTPSHDGPPPLPSTSQGYDDVSMASAARKALLKTLTATHRATMVIEHRKEMGQITKFATADLYRSQVSFQGGTPTRNVARTRASDSNRPILFVEMNPNVQKVYMGRELTVRSVEDPVSAAPGGSVYLMLEDQNLDVFRASIYGTTNTQVERLAYGATFKIRDPFMRLATDGKSAIRVDDPRSIEFVGAPDPKTCRLCRASNVEHKCLRCNKNYCSRECQVIDWKELKHKLICHC